MPSPLLQLRTLAWMRQRSRHREFAFRFARRQGLLRATVRARQGAWSARLWLRPERSDLRTFQQVFLDDFYNLTHLPRWRELEGAYRRRAQLATPLILDLGANIGLASLYLAKHWPGAEILAVEPSPANFALLERNLAPFPRLHAVQAAVAAADGAVRIVNPEGPAAGHRTQPLGADAAGAIPALSIASLLALAPCAEPWLVKVDIEGAERELFAGPLEWLDRFPIVIVEPHDWMLPGEGRARPLLRALAEREREFLVLGESVVSLSLPRE
ncbi:MAG TPA: FkbM family methyltransferase [Terriglobales bacterium]|nr:FkbM family methyltransferase [Terriglobales bacterium]